MLSRYAHERLNDPERLHRRDEMFRRMTNLFEGRPESIDERQVFTMFGVSASPMGACEEEFSVDAEGLRFLYTFLEP